LRWASGSHSRQWCWACDQQPTTLTTLATHAPNRSFDLKAEIKTHI